MKKLVQRAIIAMMLAMSITTTVNAQDGGEFGFSADLVSSYVWRGISYSANAPAIQPGMSYSIKGLEVGTWASYSFGGTADVSEFDLYASYTLPNELFSFTLTDFYYFAPSSAENVGAFFDYGKGTGHTGELAISFNGTDSFPVSIMFASNLYGADPVISEDPEDDKFNYSSYIELGYGTSVADMDLGIFCGASLMESAWYGTDGFDLINVGMSLSKSVNVKDCIGLNLSGSLICNPANETVFVVFGIGL